MNPGAPNRETDIAYQGGQVAILIGKGWKRIIAHVSNIDAKEEYEYTWRGT